MTDRPGGRMGACETSPSTSRQPGHITIFHTDPTQPPASSPPHDPPPLVGVQLVRPRLHRNRLRLRALTGPLQRDGTHRQLPGNRQQNSHTDRRQATGHGHHALLTRPAPMGATLLTLLTHRGNKILIGRPEFAPLLMSRPRPCAICTTRWRLSSVTVGMGGTDGPSPADRPKRTEVARDGLLAICPSARPTVCRHPWPTGRPRSPQTPQYLPTTGHTACIRRDLRPCPPKALRARFGS
jgi:hypothetical protein